MAEKYLVNNPDTTIKELLNLDLEKKEQIDRFAASKLLDVMRERLPSLLASFDVGELVVDRINSLDVAQVERLLLIVIQKHLRWINIFGGILGALIGFSQLVLRLLT